MIFESRSFPDGNQFMLYVTQTKSEMMILDSWGKPDDNIEFVDRDAFVTKFVSDFGFSPLADTYELADKKPFIAELRLADGYGEWYMRVPIKLKEKRLQ